MDRSLSPCDQHTKRGLPDIRIDPYFWKTVVGQLSRPFWGGKGEKNTQFSGFWLPHIYHWYILQKNESKRPTLLLAGSETFYSRLYGVATTNKIIITETQTAIQRSTSLPPTPHTLGFLTKVGSTHLKTSRYIPFRRQNIICMLLHSYYSLYFSAFFASIFFLIFSWTTTQ